MNIVVLGAGTVGTSISDLLCQHGHSVTVVDHNSDQTRQINEEFDVRAITGSASQSSVLFQAGVNTSDLCLAVTGCDEVNIIAASMAKAMGSRRSVARVYAPVFRDLSTFDYQEHFNIDRLLSLEHLTALELARGIRDPGSVVVELFARGELEVHEIVVKTPSPATRKSIRELKLPSNVRFGTIRRGNRMWIAGPDDQLEIDDRVNVFSRPEHLESIKSLFRQSREPRRRVVIAGGGETGFHLAGMLERERYKVMLMESDPVRCQFLAKNLAHTAVVRCDATRREVLQEERVGNAHVFVACTGDDENNIMAAVEARDLGASQIMALIGRPDYAQVVGKLGIDLTVSEREVMARQILAFLNPGAVVSRAKLPGGHINLVEIEVAAESPATGQRLAEAGLPPRCLVAAVIRRGFVWVPGAEDQIHADDKVIILADDDITDRAISFFTAPPARKRES